MNAGGFSDNAAAMLGAPFPGNRYFAEHIEVLVQMVG